MAEHVHRLYKNNVNNKNLDKFFENTFLKNLFKFWVDQCFETFCNEKIYDIDNSAHISLVLGDLESRYAIYLAPTVRERLVNSHNLTINHSMRRPGKKSTKNKAILHSQ